MKPTQPNDQPSMRQQGHLKRLWTLALLTASIVIFEGEPMTIAQESKAPFQPLERTIKVLSTKLNGFGIPFKVDGQDGQFIEVQLYMSRDQGRTWSFHSRQPTSAREFPFTADGDGQYWFAIKTLDRNRRLLPEGDVNAELKIVVDTQKPELAFQIQADPAGRVVCRWQASDASLDVSSFKIQYRATQGEFVPGQSIDDSWTDIPVKLTQPVRGTNWADQLAWWPDTASEQLEVRMRIADRAGNESAINRFVAVKRTAWRRSSSGSTIGQSQQQRIESFEGANSQMQRSANNSQQANSSNWKRVLKPMDTDTSVAKSSQTPINRAANTPRQTPVKQTPASDRWQLNDSSGAIAASQTSNQTLIGEIDYVAPPIPDGWAEQNPVVVSEPVQMQNPLGQKTSRRKSIVWETEVQSEESSEREFYGSTLNPAPGIAPAATAAFPKATDSIPSNPATMVRSGDNVVSESTTSWPDNQWNGPTEPIVNPQVALAPKAVTEPNRMVPISRPQKDIATSGRVTFNSGDDGSFSNASFNSKQRPQSVIDSGSSVKKPAAAMPDAANTQIISTKRFQLNYDINAIDPSGVGQVDLWMTRDRGLTWKLWGQDPDRVSPFPVEVTQEGIYGFRIVVRSKDGLAGRGPMRGDEADMWIQVDVTAPLVKITSVPYGRGSEVGNLVINYGVSDANLALRPNTLLWSTNPDGPWTKIEEDLRNEGRFLWKPARNVPQRIFLRLEAVDRAGNAGVHNLSQAIDISGLIPRGTIFGVTPVGQ